MSLPTWPAAERNKGALLEVLRDRLPVEGLVLEVASGTGQHIAWYAAHLPHLTWQPTDHDAEALGVINARTEALATVHEAVQLDATAPQWPVSGAAAMICANMIHIAPIEAMHGLMAGAGRTLPVGGDLFVYGPFLFSGRWTAQSNAAFDASLRARDPRWGVRDTDALDEQAAAHGLQRIETVEMPANNHVLVFRRAG